MKQNDIKRNGRQRFMGRPFKPLFVRYIPDAMPMLRDCGFGCYCLTI